MTKENKNKKNNNLNNKSKTIINRILWLLSIIIFAVIMYVGKDFDWSKVLNENVDFNNAQVNIELFNKTIENKTATQNNNSNIDSSTENLKIYFIDVGQADSILVMDEDKTMLIDAGTNDQGKTVVDFIKNRGISKIDYLIGTHPHEDHIGGLDDVINTFEIGEIYMPKVQTNTKTFESVLDAIATKNLTVTNPLTDSKFKLKDAECQIMCSINEQEDLNITSIVVRMVYGEQSYLFMGDAEKKNEEYRKWPQTEVLKVGHHGSDSSTTKNFLDQVQPKIAIISCGKDNKYGHPKKITLDKLSNIGATIYRTDEVGTILITSNGKINKVETNFK